ncbi:unnamed protein product [Medioppia subpectinata]|uniref:Uncharacterized protein n=1 Tax=Medioppia subpectinata TaxID=1979941 RepID=A0A7R9KKV7_9ACAR|nr:unnamed protein product [Medioppia subpectinata]CAG2105505.1 unnamed protein product [Medioppia subpectinata]
MSIDLYYMVESPPCRAVLMVGRLLDIDFNLKSLDLSKSEQLAPEFVAINPCHTVPTIVDNGYVLWESRAIITYLVNRFRPSHPLYPDDPEMRAAIDKLLHFDLGTLYRSISNYISPIFFNKDVDDLKEHKLKETLDLFDSMVAKHRFVCSDSISLADVSIVAGFSLLESTDYRLSPWINVCKWIERVKEELKDFYDEINAKAVQNTRDYIKLLKAKREIKTEK